MELYNSFVREDHIPQANRVRGMLQHPVRLGRSVTAQMGQDQPVQNLPKKREEPSDGEDGRVLDARRDPRLLVRHR